MEAMVREEGALLQTLTRPKTLRLLEVRLYHYFQTLEYERMGSWGQYRVGLSITTACPCDNPAPEDGTHVLMCSRRREGRPENVEQILRSEGRIGDLRRWIRAQKHFGMAGDFYPVKWINLSNPSNTIRSRKHQCHICRNTFTPSCIIYRFNQCQEVLYSLLTREVSRYKIVD